MEKVLYWAFEGSDGTGKTRLSRSFSDKFGAFWTYEPNAETEELKYLRELALTKNDSITKYSRENLLIANRSIHQESHIQPLLNNLNTVVSDRSFLSGMVYAKLETFTFDKFFELMKLSNILSYPDVIIYVTNKSRKIDKNYNDIYDNAPEDLHQKVELIYEEALEYIQKNISTKHIKIIRFENNFDNSIDDNVDRLIEIIKKEYADC